MSKKELEKEKASLVKWIGEMEDASMISILSELRRNKRSFEEIRKQLGELKLESKKAKSDKLQPKEEYNEFQKFLLTIPPLSDEHLAEIEAKRKHLNEWK